MTLAELRRQASINVFGEAATNAALGSRGSSGGGGGVGCTISLDDFSSRRINSFMRAMSLYQKRLGNSQAVAVRRATIALVKSLRARTLKAKKKIPASNVTRCTNPRYLTPKGGGTAQKAWNVKRRGGSDEKIYIHAADSKADARRRFGTISQYGLAKLSWGWFMKTLFNRANPTEGNPNAKIDERMVNGHFREITTGGNPRVEVLIVNKLGYIREALPNGALDEAMHSATKFMYGQFITENAKAREELGL